VRLIQVTIPAGKRDAVLDALADEGADYVLSDETSGRQYTAIAYVPVPQTAVEPILERLREVGIEEDGYTVVLDASTVVSRDFDALQERYAEDDDSDERIAREELIAAARDLAPPFSTYVILTVVSAVIATAGLLLDSPAVVVGSMVIAPLVGPAMAAGIGSVLDEGPLFRRGVKLQVLGLGLSVASAAVFAAGVRYIQLIPPIADVTTIPQVRERIAPDFLSLAVALGAGVAGVISLSSGVSTALVGVMIAVALIPPAATVGIGIAWGQPMTTLGATVLTLVNVLSINLAALVTLWYKGYRPERWFRTDEARSATIKRVAVLGVAILILSAFLGGVTLDSIQRAQTSDAIQASASEVVADSEAVLLEVDVEYTNTAVFQRATHVRVRLGIPPDGASPQLAGPLDAAFDRTADRDVRTEVQYVAVEQV
jgi:uncharacterized hydrophobic protein (TIGR00341 family)